MGEGVSTIISQPAERVVYEKWGNTAEQKDHIHYGLDLNVFDKMSSEELEEYEDEVGLDYGSWMANESIEAYLAYLKKQGYSAEDLSAVKAIYDYTKVDNSDFLRSASQRARNGKYDDFDRKYGVDKMVENVENLIKKSPKYSKTTYRGMALPAKDVAKLKKGASFDMNGISSWSDSKGNAGLFAQLNKGSGDRNVVFVSPRQPRGTSVSHYSAQGDEAEILVSHTARYTIGKVDDQGNFVYVYLKPR